MALNPRPTYPASGCYVLKLHRDSVPQDGRIAGLLEHVSSGECLGFDSAAQLLTLLVGHAAAYAVPGRPGGTGDGND